MTIARERLARPRGAVHLESADAEPSTAGRFVRFVLPLILLALTLGAVVVIGPPLIPADRVAWLLGLGLACALLRPVMPRRPGPWGWPLFLLHFALSLAMVLLFPFAAFYAWVGYIDGGYLFRGRAHTVALLLTSVTMVAAQTYGLGGLFAVPAATLVLLVANAVPAWGATRLGQKQEEAVTRREDAVHALEEAHRENADLQRQLLVQARESGVLQERARLSREIHDTVAQSLVGILTQLEAIDADEDGWRGRVAQADASAREALMEARRAVRALASPRLDEADLPGAVADLARAVTARSGLQVTMTVDGSPRPGAHDHVLLRVCQEALSNTVRHAGATRATVTLSYLGDEVRLDVRDDGTGFDPAAAPRGHGLAGMRTRVREAGGSLDVETAPGEGCTVSAAVPADAGEPP